MKYLFQGKPDIESGNVKTKNWLRNLERGSGIVPLAPSLPFLKCVGGSVDIYIYTLHPYQHYHQDIIHIPTLYYQVLVVYSVAMCTRSK